MERIIFSRKICVIRLDTGDEVIASAKEMFNALGSCSLFEDRTGIEWEVRRDALLFSKWRIELPKARVVVTREMMGI